MLSSANSGSNAGQSSKSSRFALALTWAVLCARFRRVRRDESGQAMVESAIVMPLMIFLILGIVQLAMMQHAKIMTEYAAYNAARSGIVWNADRFIMENAAIISLLPTNDGLLQQSDIGNPMQMLKRILQRALLYQVNRRLPQAVNMIKGGAKAAISKIPIGKLGQGALNSAVGVVGNAARAAAEQAATTALGKLMGSSDDRMVRVDILNPNLGFTAPTGLGNWKGLLGGSFGSAKQEIEFDDFKMRTQSRLVIRVRYLYMMRIPFANWVIHSAWLAGRAGKRLYGAIWNPQEQENETGFRNVADYKTPQQFNGGGLFSAFHDIDVHDVEVAAQAAQAGTYLLPIYASHSMRMQSNPYRKSVQLK